jgi:hypothetical protein
VQAKDSPITHNFLGVDFPDTNYFLKIRIKAGDGTYFEPVITNEGVGSFTFTLEVDGTMEYEATYSPLPTGS